MTNLEKKVRRCKPSICLENKYPELFKLTVKLTASTFTSTVEFALIIDSSRENWVCITQICLKHI